MPLTAIARNWWVFALRGVLAVLFGIAVLVWPQLALPVLVAFFGAFALVDGVFAIIAAFRDREHLSHWWVQLIEGIAGVVLGILTLIWPGITALALVYLIAAWAIVTGILEIIAAIEMRKVIENEILLALGGIASVIFGVLAAISPGAGALAIVWLIGLYAILFGILEVALALRLRSWGERQDQTSVRGTV